MALFQSKYPELSFYVHSCKHSFSNGSYSTDDTEVIAVLETLTDAIRIDEPKKSEPSKRDVKSEQKAEEQPSTRRKTSAK